jgi:hypothetical protein
MIPVHGPLGGEHSIGLASGSRGGGAPDPVQGLNILIVKPSHLQGPPEPPPQRSSRYGARSASLDAISSKSRSGGSYPTREQATSRASRRSRAATVYAKS